MATLTRLTDGQRRGLQVGGVVCLAIGVVLFVVGPIMFVLGPIAVVAGGPSQSSDFDDVGSGVATGFIAMMVLGFLSFVFVAAGATMARFGFMKPVSEIVATETGGALEHAGERGGSGLGRGLAKSGIGGGHSSSQVIKIKCRSCGYLESEDAKFCSGCGQQV